MMVTGGNAFILNYTLPINVWSDVSLIGINNATYFVVRENNGSEQVHEFTTTIGDYSNSFIWNNPMSIEAPVAEIGGGLFKGQMKSVVLKDGADEKYAGDVTPLVIGVAPYT
jgi:hexosaminidase